jgi:hypothetical protein
VTANKQLAAGIGIAVVLALIGVVAVAAGGGDDDKDSAAVDVDAGKDDGGLPGPGEVGTDESTTTLPGATPAGEQPTATTAAPTGGTTGTLPGQTSPPPPCTPKDVKGTGISKTEVVIGQIVSDVSMLPAQLYPNYEGLQAYVNVVNAAGGVCGRKIRIEYSNDQSNPATHEYQAMTHRVFAFVANSSLMDNTDYESDAPFNPRYQDNGEYVPDIGGLAYSYGRSQSPWHAGAIGSISPALSGGKAFKAVVENAKAEGTPCKKAGVVYLREPTGASEDSGRAGGAALAADWGGNFGADGVKYYVANLADPVVVYEQMVTQMIADGVNCAFTYSDLGSDINLVRAMANRGVWPKDKCSGPTCFAAVYVPFAAYDPKFIRDSGDAAKGVRSFIPHIPLNETSAPPMQAYLNGLKTVKGAEPSTFSIIGWTSGQMFVQALQSCGAAPTRKCVMDYARNLKDFDAGGLQTPITPFRSTRVDCSSGCGNFAGRGTYNFKWIFACNVSLQIQDRGGKRDWYRVFPAQGYDCDTLRVVRGKPA